MGISRAAVDIALRDMLRTGRSFFAVMFALIMPLMIVGIMYLAMGGMMSDEEPTLPRISVYIVNQDVPQGTTGATTFSAGQLLVDVFQSEELSKLFAVTLVTDEAVARAAVDTGEAGVAVIIPETLTASLYDAEGQSKVVMIQDPTLTIAPGIVKAVLAQFLDAFSGSRIAVDVLLEGFKDAGVPPDPDAIQKSITSYTTWAEESGAALRAGELTLATLQPVSAAAAESNPFLDVMGGVMSAMLVFYVFYTGSAAAQSIMREEEEGTLPRLFMAPVTTSTILAGKVLGAVLILVVQVVVLLVASNLVFGVHWGAPLPVAMAAVALIALAASFGIFVMSLVKTSNQVGVIYGAVMTMTGLFGTYAFFLPLPEAFRRYALITPQGWAMQSWDLVVHGAGIEPALLFSIAVSLAIAVGFFVIGTLRFRRRFAR